MNRLNSPHHSGGSHLDRSGRPRSSRMFPRAAPALAGDVEPLGWSAGSRQVLWDGGGIHYGEGGTAVVRALCPGATCWFTAPRGARTNAASDHQRASSTPSAILASRARTRIG
jgi:hypothetical protein